MDPDTDKEREWEVAPEREGPNARPAQTSAEPKTAQDPKTPKDPKEPRIQGPRRDPGDPQEPSLEKTLRPQRFEQFMGQKELKEKLAIFVTATKSRGECLDHVLFHGPPGLGKTSLAYILSRELGVGFKSTSGPALEKPGSLAALLTNLEPMDIFFIDEIHRLSHAVEEYLYPAMEDYRIDLVVGEGAGARSVRLETPPFTLIGATTRAGLLTPPLRDRFGIQLRLDFYQNAELAQIVTRAAQLLNLDITPEGAMEIARRSRGTPRVAGRLLRRVRDFAEVRAQGHIDQKTADLALKMMEIDHRGLDQLDRQILRTICLRFAGGPVGLETLASTVGEEADTIMEVYEPYLIKENFIYRAPRGRKATTLAFTHLGLTPPEPEPLAD
ncbi:MAG: Holliday junction branch migration DNA helicase RuvB [Deltaproteobacteria bacterium]|jgi:Holliday junction DNA helicase RuvB|nr:Holliday junction branch migration DNA helicase RuvB [Deltaproteobacteria bacterium]